MGNSSAAPAPTWNGASYGAVSQAEYGPAETWQIGGSRFALWDSGALNPIGYGPVIQNGAYAVQSVPPSYGVVGTGSAPGGTNSNASAIAQTASASPFNPAKSPLLWVVGGLVVALVYMDLVQWKGGRK